MTKGNWIGALVAGVLAVSPFELILAAGPDAILSIEDARQMFSLPRPAWEENVRQLKAGGYGNYAITPTGEYTMYMRPAPGTGLLAVTPSYNPGNDSAPWKLSVTVAADEEPAHSIYNAMSHDEVEELVKVSASEMTPDFSVMGYMVRGSQSVPSVHFTIFKAGDFPPIDLMVGSGNVCPLSGGEPKCIRAEMIQ